MELTMDSYGSPEDIEHEARLQFLTWDRTQADIDSPAHRARQARWAALAGASFHPTAYVAAEAAIFTTHLVLGEASWIAGHALVRGDVEFGAVREVVGEEKAAERDGGGEGIK